MKTLALTTEDGIEAALGVVERGLKIFPLPPGSRKATLPDWPNRATDDPEIVKRYWPRRANIGVPMKPNTLVGIDLDRHDPAKDGMEAFTALCEKHDQPWPATFTVRTTRDGLHLYFRMPTGRRLGNTSGRLAPGIDTRGPGVDNDGGYLVGPGSVVNGKPYEIVRDVPIITLPDWLAELLDPPRAPARPVGPAGPMPRVDDRYVLAALTGEIQRILDCGSAEGGGRNDQLNRSAYALGQLVAAGLLGEMAAEDALYRAAEAVCLVRDDGERQTRATIRSGLRSGMQNPRQMRGTQ